MGVWMDFRSFALSVPLCTTLKMLSLFHLTAPSIFKVITPLQMIWMHCATYLVIFIFPNKDLSMFVFSELCPDSHPFHSRDCWGSWQYFKLQSSQRSRNPCYDGIISVFSYKLCWPSTVAFEGSIAIHTLIWCGWHLCFGVFSHPNLCVIYTCHMASRYHSPLPPMQVHAYALYLGDYLISSLYA